MLRKLFLHPVRIACISIALALVAPLIPGVSFTGSLAEALALGSGLWLLYVAIGWLVEQNFGVRGGARVTALIIFLYVMVSILYVFAMGAVLPTGLHISIAGPLPGIECGIVALAGALFSNVVDRLVDWAIGYRRDD